MSARYVLDTNIALYFLGGRLVQSLPTGEFYLSVISEMEMLSYPTISDAEHWKIEQLLSQVTIVGLGNERKKTAIESRRKYRLKWPDAIVCATALRTEATLLSNDEPLGGVTEIRTEMREIQ